MRAAFIALGLCALALIPPATAGVPPAVGDAPLPTLAPMIRKVSPAVVNVQTRGTVRDNGTQSPLLQDPFFRRFFDTQRRGQPREHLFRSAGSGVIVDARQGYIVTNSHVVQNATDITVTLQ